MYKYLFFDDQKLLQRAGLERVYGKPELVKDSVYTDGHSSTDFPTSYIFRTEDGKYRLVYQGHDVDGKMHCYMAASDDGLHFEPVDLTNVLPLENRIADNEIMPIAGEIGTIIEDNINNPTERYKMLLTQGPDREHHLWIDGPLLTSPDLLHWTVVPGVRWNVGNEPVVGAFYNKFKGCFTILQRPWWGDRRVGYVETKDWRHFTPYELCLQCDSLDAPLDEVYGMPAMEYEGRYIGFPLIYSDFTSTNMVKFNDGTIKPQLAYSWDGNHWQRSLRTPFIDGMTEECEEAFGWKCYLVWLLSAMQVDSGDIRFYAATSGYEHGPAFKNMGKGRIGVWQLPRDRFIGLTTKSADEPGVLDTRENIWDSGELHVNLSAKKATLAVYEVRDEAMWSMPFLIDGYSHEDCVPFSGDSTDWVPVFKNGKKLDELRGKTVMLEIKIEDGTIYSLSGDFTSVMNTEAVRYRQLGGIRPKRVII